jgi:iron(III) transport system permease protein
VLFLPVAVAGTRSAVQALPIGTEEVAANLGASRVKVLWRVIIPAAGPGIAASGALVLLTTIKELPVTLLLRPTGMDTLATDLWAHMLVSDRSAAAPLMGLIILAAAAPALAVDRMTGGAR